MFADPCTSNPFDAARVAALINGNDAPHDAERAQMRAFLNEAQGNLANYEEKMELLRKDLNALREEHDVLHCDAQDARSILHPIRMLSDDRSPRDICALYSSMGGSGEENHRQVGGVALFVPKFQKCAVDTLACLL